MTSAKFTEKVNSLFEEYLEICDSTIDDVRSLRDIWNSKNMQSKISKTFAVDDKKKNKKKKDKNAPKKGKTAFILWSNDERVKIAKEIEKGMIEKIGNKEMISVLATRWASFKQDGGDISKYEEMALKDKERYEKEKEEYSSGASEDEEDGKDKKRKGNKNTNGSKRNKSAYLFYTSDKDVRSELKSRRPDISNNEIIKALAEQWKMLKTENPDEAQKYFDMASEDKKRYDAEKSVKEKKVTEEVVESESEVIEEEDPEATQFFEAPVKDKEVIVEEEEEEVIKKKKKSKRKIVDSDDEEEDEKVIKKKRKSKKNIVDDE